MLMGTMVSYILALSLNRVHESSSQIVLVASQVYWPVHRLQVSYEANTLAEIRHTRERFRVDFLLQSARSHFHSETSHYN